jgi:hypothetical protein
MTSWRESRGARREMNNEISTSFKHLSRVHCLWSHGPWFREHHDVANTGLQSKLNLDHRFWRYNTFNEEKGRLFNFHNHLFVVHKQKKLHLYLAHAKMCSKHHTSKWMLRFMISVKSRQMLFFLPKNFFQSYERVAFVLIIQLQGHNNNEA